MSPKPRARASAKKPTSAKPRAASKRQAIAKTKPPVSKQQAAPEPESIPVTPIANSETPPHPTPAAPLTRSEVSTRGARADTRGGTLSVVSASGPSRTINARSVGLSALDNGVLAPWGDGWFIAVFGIRTPDLGASAIIETGKIRLRGRAAYNPCPP